MIDRLEEQVRLQLAELMGPKPRASANAEHRGTRVSVSAYQLRNGKSIFKYSFDGVRLERSLLLQLLCTETDCPQCKVTQAKWAQFRGMLAPSRRVIQPSYAFKHLTEEHHIEVAGRTCVARPAVFQCRISCSAKAHGQAVVRKTGWDLFEGNRYLTGGLITNPETLEQEPTIPTIDAAKNWLARSYASHVDHPTYSKHSV